MRDVTVPWSYLFVMPEPPVVPRLRELLEPALLLVLMLVPLLVPLITPALFARLMGAILLLAAPFSVPLMMLAVTGKNLKPVAPHIRSSNPRSRGQASVKRSNDQPVVEFSAAKMSIRLA